MKAKTYFHKLKDAKTIEELEQNISQMLIDLINDALSLIDQRHCKTNDAIASCITEVNQKYLRICELCNNFSQDVNNFGQPLQMVKLDNDGFKATFVATNPKYSFCFDLKKHEEKMHRTQELYAKGPDPIIYTPLTPLKDLKYEDLRKEFILDCIRLSEYSKFMPLGMLQPLANRMAIIEKWIKQGFIDYTDIEERNNKNAGSI